MHDKNHEKGTTKPMLTDNTWMLHVSTALLSNSPTDMHRFPAQSAKRLGEIRCAKASLRGRLAVDKSMQGQGAGAQLLLSAGAVLRGFCRSVAARY